LGDSEVLALFWVVVAWGYRAWGEPDVRTATNPITSRPPCQVI
jgi:hypothetical protein